MIEETKRLSYIDWAKGIGICLIMLGHLLPNGCFPKTIIYSFHVPLFAFVGGLLTKAPTSLSKLGQKIWRLTKRLLIPYTIWFLIFCIPYLLVPEVSFYFIKKPLGILDIVEKYFFLDSTSIWNAALWFIPCYYVVSVFFLFFSYCARGSAGASIILAMVTLYACVYMNLNDITLNLFGYTDFMGFSQMLILLAFFALGFGLKWLVNDIMHRTDNKYKNPYLLVSVGIFAMSVMAAARVRLSTKNLGGYATLSIYSDLYGDIVMYIILALMLTVSFVLVCGLLPKFKFANLFSKNSLFIMSTHYVIFFFPISSRLSKAEWLLDMQLGFLECGILILVYAVILYLLNIAIKKGPKAVKVILGFLGIR